MHDLQRQDQLGPTRMNAFDDEKAAVMRRGPCAAPIVALVQGEFVAGFQKAPRRLERFHAPVQLD